MMRQRCSALPIRLATGMILATGVGCSADAGEIMREIEAASEGCTESELRAAAEECVQMFERFAAMGSEAMESYVGALQSLEEAVRRREDAIIDSGDLGRAISPERSLFPAPAFSDQAPGYLREQRYRAGGSRYAPDPRYRSVDPYSDLDPRYSNPDSYYYGPDPRYPNRDPSYFPDPGYPNANPYYYPVPGDPNAQPYYDSDPRYRPAEPYYYGDPSYSAPDPYFYSDPRDGGYPTPSFRGSNDPYYQYLPSDVGSTGYAPDPRYGAYPPVERGVLLPPEQRLRRPWLDGGGSYYDSYPAPREWAP